MFVLVVIKDIEKIIKAVDIDNLILFRFRLYWEKIYDERPSEYKAQRSPELVNYLNNFLAYSFFGILKTWLQNGKKQPPEIMGKLLYSLTGPPTLTKVRNEFKDLIK